MIVEREQLLGVGNEPLARGCRREGPVRAVEKLRAEQLLQTLDLLADRGLRQIEQAGGLRDTAGLDDGDEGSEQTNVDVARQVGLLSCGPRSITGRYT